MGIEQNLVYKAISTLLNHKYTWCKQQPSHLIIVISQISLVEIMVRQSKHFSRPSHGLMNQDSRAPTFLYLPVLSPIYHLHSLSLTSLSLSPLPLGLSPWCDLEAGSTGLPGQLEVPQVCSRERDWAGRQHHQVSRSQVTACVST